jgi:transketolase
MQQQRQNVLDQLIPYFERDDSYHLLFCDCGFAVLDKLAEKFPKRITNVGVMEQATVGIAAGMAMGGMKPIVYSIASFLVRALEQIRLDVVVQNLPVKIIGTGSGDYFKHLGVSHCIGMRDVWLMNDIGMPVYDNFQDWINLESYGYLRV